MENKFLKIYLFVKTKSNSLFLWHSMDLGWYGGHYNPKINTLVPVPKLLYLWYWSKPLHYRYFPLVTSAWETCSYIVACELWPFEFVK